MTSVQIVTKRAMRCPRERGPALAHFHLRRTVERCRYDEKVLGRFGARIRSPW